MEELHSRVLGGLSAPVKCEEGLKTQISPLQRYIPISEAWEGRRIGEKIGGRAGIGAGGQGV